PDRCNVWETGIGGTAPVGRYIRGASPYGVYDMCGNVWEWCATERVPGRYERRGGSFATPLSQCLPALSADGPAGLRADDPGFRCVMGWGRKRVAAPVRCGQVHLSDTGGSAGPIRAGAPGLMRPSALATGMTTGGAPSRWSRRDRAPTR